MIRVLILLFLLSSCAKSTYIVNDYDCIIVQNRKGKFNNNSSKLILEFLQLSHNRIPSNCHPLQVLADAIEMKYNNKFGQKLCISYEMLNDVLMGAKTIKPIYRKDINYFILEVNNELIPRKIITKR